MKRFALPLALVGLVVAMLVGLAIGVPVGQNNPATPPTPAPPPSNPVEWITGIAIGKIQIPSVIMGGTMKIEFGLGNCAPFKYEGPQNATAATFVIAYAQGCGDADLDIAALLKTLGLDKFGLPAGIFKRSPKPVPPAPYVEWSSGPDGSCTVKGPSDLARDCRDISREGMANLHPALPDPFPPALPMPPVPEPISITIQYAGFEYSVSTFKTFDPSERGHVLTFKKTSPNGFSYARDVYINADVESFCGIRIWGENKDMIRVSYNCDATGAAATFQVWTMAELFN